MLNTLKSKLILAFSVIFLLLAAVFMTGYLGISNIYTHSQSLISQIPRDANAALTAASNDINQSRSTSQLWLVVIVSIAAATSLGICVFASLNLTKGLKTVRLALDKMAQGDLSQSLTLQTQDESGKMAAAYREMQRYLIDMIGDLKTDAEKLNAAGHNLHISASQSSEATKQVALSSQQMAQGAQEQSTNAQDTAKQIEALVVIINQVSQDAAIQLVEIQSATKAIDSVSVNISDMVKDAQSASQDTRNAEEMAIQVSDKNKLSLSGIERIKSATSESTQKIEDLSARSSEIGKIVAVIDDIASQTNLLALNAAIEAARAGEQGRGFAVVSDEVRKLAERTAGATKEIADLIRKVQKDISEATSVMQGGTQAVTEGYALAVEVDSTLENIRNVTSSVNQRIAQINAAAKEIDSSTQILLSAVNKVSQVSRQTGQASEKMSLAASGVSKSIETVAGIAEENSAATEEVSASTQEMSVHVQELAASSRALQDIAEQIGKCTEKFTLNSNLISTDSKSSRG
jgi:methyl-accepting chemotaxis protein